MAWKSNDPFPNNMASGPFSSSTIFVAMWDFQQQAIIDEVVEKCMTLFHSYEDAVGPTSVAYPFTFAGYMIDEPKLIGDFYRWSTNTNSDVPTDLTYWTGKNSSLIHGTITHEYATYSEGMAAFYKKLNTRMKEDFPDAKWILQPWRIYNATGFGTWAEWVYQISGRSDKDQLTPDMLSQEEPSTLFVDDNNIYNSGMNITKDMVGISQVSQSAEYENRLYNAKAAINGGWSNWFGLFGQGKNTPYFNTITDVYPRLKLVRCIPNWDNLNNVPVGDGISRTWDGSVYQSTKSYISSDVMYSRHPKTGKLFAVFNTTNGVIKLNTGESVTSVKRTDGYFIETTDGSADVTISGNEIRLKSSVTIDVDSSNGQVKGKGYIFTLSSTVPGGSLSINSGAAYTKSTSVTLNLSATDNVGVTGYYLSTSSTTPSATATGWTSVTSTASFGASVSYTLSSGDGSKTVYAWYKDSSGNVSATTNDSITLDTTAPAITITTPTSNSTYSTTSSTISLGGSASDSTSGVSSITWSSDRGGSGTASGTTAWSISSIALSSGNNVITVTATDAAGNNGTTTITVSSSTNSLQAYYTLDDGTGSTATDSSGNNKNGTINGAAWTTGKVGNGLSFNGTSDYVSIPLMNYDEISNLTG